MALDTVAPSNTIAKPRKPRPWFTPVAAPPDATAAEVQRLTRERIHFAVGAQLKRSTWFAAAVVCDIGSIFDTTDFGAPDRERPYLVIGTSYWRDRWTKTRFDLGMAPCTAVELEYYRQPATLEIAKYAFAKYRHVATYRVVLMSQGAFIDTLQKWGQQ